MDPVVEDDYEQQPHHHEGILSEISTTLNNSAVVYNYPTMDLNNAPTTNAAASSELDWNTLSSSSIDFSTLSIIGQLSALNSLNEKLKQNKLLQQQQASSSSSSASAADESTSNINSPAVLAASSSATLSATLALTISLNEKFIQNNKEKNQQNLLFWNQKEMEIKEKKSGLLQRNNNNNNTTINNSYSQFHQQHATLRSPIRV
jgi:hypothetical protein